MDNDVHRVLVAATGSVASIKIPELLKNLLKSPQIQVKLMVTQKAKQFFDLKDLPEGLQIFDDDSEWNSWKQRGDPVLHIDLTKWADIMVMAPLDANTMAKMSNGICDNLVTCATRAWDLAKPLFFCPAMNTKMWSHPITAQQVSTLKSWGHTIIPPISKTLMCGDQGVGAMEEPDKIVKFIFNTLLWHY